MSAKHLVQVLEVLEVLEVYVCNLKVTVWFSLNIRKVGTQCMGQLHQLPHIGLIHLVSYSFTSLPFSSRHGMCPKLLMDRSLEKKFDRKNCVNTILYQIMFFTPKFCVILSPIPLITLHQTQKVYPKEQCNK